MPGSATNDDDIVINISAQMSASRLLSQRRSPPFTSIPGTTSSVRPTRLASRDDSDAFLSIGRRLADNGPAPAAGHLAAAAGFCE
jgi:hypothetical protein